MKRVLLILVVVVLVIVGYWYFMKGISTPKGNEKQPALTARKHSALFNKGIDSLLQAYFAANPARFTFDPVSTLNDSATPARTRQAMASAALKNLRVMVWLLSRVPVGNDTSYVSPAGKDLGVRKHNSKVLQGCVTLRQRCVEARDCRRMDFSSRGGCV